MRVITENIQNYIKKMSNELDNVRGICLYTHVAVATRQKTKEESKMPKAITATNKGTSLELGFDTEARTALKAFVEAKKTESEAKKAKEAAEEILRTKLGLHEFATIGGVKAFKLEHRQRVDINRTTLRDAFPEAFEACSYDNAYDFVSAL